MKLGTTYTPEFVTAGNRVILLAHNNATISGAGIAADEVRVDVGGNLLVESKQNSYTSSGSEKGTGNWSNI